MTVKNVKYLHRPEYYFKVGDDVNDFTGLNYPCDIRFTCIFLCDPISRELQTFVDVLLMLTMITTVVISLYITIKTWSKHGHLEENLHPVRIYYILTTTKNISHSPYYTYSYVKMCGYNR